VLSFVECLMEAALQRGLVAGELIWKGIRFVDVPDEGAAERAGLCVSLVPSPQPWEVLSRIFVGLWSAEALCCRAGFTFSSYRGLPFNFTATPWAP
jgi:hypothetical protein